MPSSSFISCASAFQDEMGRKDCAELQTFLMQLDCLSASKLFFIIFLSYVKKEENEPFRYKSQFPRLKIKRQVFREVKS